MAKKWFKFRNKPKFMNVLVGIIMLALYGLVGTKLLTAIAGSLNATDTPFVDGYKLLGFGASGSTLDGTISSTGLIGVLFIVASAAVIVSAFVQLNFN